MCCISIRWKFHYFSSKIAFSILREHACNCVQHHLKWLWRRRKKEKEKFDFKVCMLEPFSLFSESDTSVLSLSLAGWMVAERPHEGQQKERKLTRTHTYTNRHTSKFQTVADGFNSLPSFFHNLSGNLLWMTVPPFHALVRWLNAPLFCQKKGGKQH